MIIIKKCCDCGTDVSITKELHDEYPNTEIICVDCYKKRDDKTKINEL